MQTMIIFSWNQSVHEISLKRMDIDFYNHRDAPVKATNFEWLLKYYLSSIKKIKNFCFTSKTRKIWLHMDIRKSINGIAIAQKINIKMEFAMTSATSLSVFGMATIVIISDRKADITLI